jgi:hypothetical protein
MVMSHSVVPEYGLLGSCQVDVTLGRCLSAGWDRSPRPIIRMRATSGTSFWLSYGPVAPPNRGAAFHTGLVRRSVEGDPYTGQVGLVLQEFPVEAVCLY